MKSGLGGSENHAVVLRVLGNIPVESKRLPRSEFRFRAPKPGLWVIRVQVGHLSFSLSAEARIVTDDITDPDRPR